MTEFDKQKLQNGLTDRETINNVSITDRLNSDNAFSDIGLENNRKLNEAVKNKTSH